MRLPLRNNKKKTNTSSSFTVQAPTGGLDTLHPLANMPPDSAPILDNWIPRPGYVELRKGYQGWTTSGITDPCNTLMTYRGAATQKLFAVSDDTIYDCSAAGAATATSVTALNSDILQYVNFSTSAGNFLFYVNGFDTPGYYNGTAWTTSTITGSGLTSSNLSNIMVFKKMLFMSEKGTLKVWILPVDSLSGAASLLNLGSIASLGGDLVAMGTWSTNGGEGYDDLAVFITSQGQAIVYQGTDPTLSYAWSLVGVYRIGLPLGPRCVLKSGADLNIITTDGIVPFSQAISRDRAQDEDIALTAKIQNSFSQATQTYFDNFGWQIISYPRNNLIICNVPVSSQSSSVQFIMNAVTGAWARWTNINAIAWEIYNEKPYFSGPDGLVYQADVGALDGIAPITADMETAFNYFGTPSQIKQFQMIRPIMTTNGNVNPAIQMNVDFQNSTPIAIPTVSTPSGALWGTAHWGVGKWGNTLQTVLRWTGLAAVGRAGAVRMRVVTQAGTPISAQPVTLQIIGFDVIYELGGFL